MHRRKYTSETISFPIMSVLYNCHVSQLNLSTIDCIKTVEFHS